MIEARAAITDGFGKLWIDTIEVSPPGPDEVLVELRAAGVCHTDYDFMNREVLRVLGHEGAGVVVDVVLPAQVTETGSTPDRGDLVP